jgi:hypothetical protein
MIKNMTCGAAALFVSAGIASAQLYAPDLPDAANPAATSPASNDRGSSPSDRPPAVSMPDAKAPDPATVGQAPATSEKMHPEMDSVGTGKTPPGAEMK